MDSKETHQQQQNRNAAAALASPTSTSQAMQNRSSVGPQQALIIDGGDSDGGENTNSASSGPPAKQNRNALGGGPLTAHVLDVNAGEDIVKKLQEFINQETRDVCILSASGALSSAVLQSNDRLRLVKYEGSYVIVDLSMSAISLKTASDGTLISSASLHVSLAGPDCKVVGGRVGGKLVAGSQVQVIVGFFGPEGVKLSAASAPANVLSSSGVVGPGFPQSQGPQRSSQSSPLHQVGNSTPQPLYHLSLWPGNNPQ